MAMVGNFYFPIFFQLTWEFLDPESERGGFVYWPNNKIIDYKQLFGKLIQNKVSLAESAWGEYGRLSEKVITEITGPFSEEELKYAVFDMRVASSQVQMASVLPFIENVGRLSKENSLKW